jgi:hypothetical protein
VTKRNTLLTTFAVGLGIVLGYGAVTGRLQRLFAEDKAPPAQGPLGGSIVLPERQKPGSFSLDQVL